MFGGPFKNIKRQKRSHGLTIIAACSLLSLVGRIISRSDFAFAQASGTDYRIAKGDYFSIESFPLPSYLRGDFNTLTHMDFDRDGDPDLILPSSPGGPPWPSPGGQGPFVALRNDGKGHFVDASSTVFHHDAACGVLYLLVFDFNKDGRQDLFVPAWGSDPAPQLGAQNQIFFQTANGRLTNETNPRLPAIMDATWGATAGDIDKDGDLDIFCCGGAPWIGLGPYFLINDGKGFFSLTVANLPEVLQPARGNWQGYIYNSSLFLDVDKDGDLDLVMGAWVGETGPAFRPRDTILLNDGTGVFTFAPDDHLPLRYGGKGWGTLQNISADFNQDGWPDLIMYTDNYMPNGTRLQLILNNCDGTFRDASNNLPRVGVLAYWTRLAVDINNDGWMDYFDCDGTGLRLFLNRGNAKFIEMRDTLLPLPKDRIINIGYPFDLDKDGDIDIFGISNPPNGIGYVFRQLKPYVFSSKVLFPALLQSPANNASRLPASLTLRWTDQNKKPYPEETQYQVRVRSEGGTYKYFNVKKGRAYLRLTGLAAGTTYSWNVKAIGNGKDIKDSEWAVSGNDWSFRIRI